MEKKEIRKKIRELKNKVSDEELKTSSLIVAKKVLSLEEYKGADIILAYIPTNQEITTWEIINDAFKLGKKVAAPKCFGKEMEFFFFDDVNQLSTGAFGILEPPEDNRFLQTDINECEKKVFMLVPGMAFDKNYNRIGYGGGFYDRFFSKYKSLKLFKCGLCHDFQVIDNIEREEHDYCVDVVISSGKE